MSPHPQDGHLKMLGGYLEFFMDPALAEIYRSLKLELDDLIQTKVSENFRYARLSNFSRFHVWLNCCFLVYFVDVGSRIWFPCFLCSLLDLLLIIEFW